MALLQAKTTTINGITYTSPGISAARYLYLMPRLTVLFGERLISIFMAAVNMAAGASGDEEKLAAAVGQLATDPKVLSKLLIEAAAKAADPNGIFGGDGLNVICRDLLEGVTCDKYRMGAGLVDGGEVLARGAFEEHFKAHPMELVQLAMWVASVHFFGSTAESDSTE